MSGRNSVATIAQVVIAVVALVGVAGGAVHYVGAQTGKVQLQGAKLESVTKEIFSISNTLQSHDKRLASLENTLQSQDDRLASLGNTLQSHDKRLASLENTLQSQDDRLASLENTLGLLASQTKEWFTAAEARENERDTELLTALEDILKKWASQVNGEVSD